MTLTNFSYLADENIDPELIDFLLEQGFDIISVREIDLVKTSDSLILQKAVELNRVILTHDSDFGQLIYSERQRFIGIVRLRPGHFSGAFHIHTMKSLLKADLTIYPPFHLIAENTEGLLKIRLRNTLEL